MAAEISSIVISPELNSSTGAGGDTRHHPVWGGEGSRLGMVGVREELESHILREVRLHI